MHTRASPNAEYVLLNFVRVSDLCCFSFFVVAIAVGPGIWDRLPIPIRHEINEAFSNNIFFEISASFGSFG